jgi:hypothetical protein
MLNNEKLSKLMGTVIMTNGVQIALHTDRNSFINNPNSAVILMNLFFTWRFLAFLAFTVAISPYPWRQ